MRLPTAAVSLLLALPAPAAAYIDPGTGSYVFQVIVASIAGFLYVLSLYWKRFLALFLPRRDGPAQGSAADGAARAPGAADGPDGGPADPAGR